MYDVQELPGNPLVLPVSLNSDNAKDNDDEIIDDVHTRDAVHPLSVPVDEYDNSEDELSEDMDNDMVDDDFHEDSTPTANSLASASVDHALNFMLGGIRTRSGRVPTLNLRYKV